MLILTKIKNMIIQNKEVKLLLFLMSLLIVIGLFNYSVKMVSGVGSDVATISSEIYSITSGLKTMQIEDVSIDTSKSDFLSLLNKDNENQTWDVEQINDPVLNANSLIVTSEDGRNKITYYVNVPVTCEVTVADGSITTISSNTYTITYEGIYGIIEVEEGTTLDNLSRYLIKDQSGQTWDIRTNVRNNDPVQDGDKIIVTAEDQCHKMTYILRTVSVAPLSDISTISSLIYTVDNNEGSTSISGIEEGTSRSVFLENIQKDEDNQIWDDQGLHDPVQNNDFLRVTSQDLSKTADYVLIIESSDNENNDLTILSSSSPASLITGTTAVLNGSISLTGNEEPVAGFQYGMDTQYGTTIEASQFSSDQEYSITIAPLICGTTYHYRSYATNSIETVYGNDMTFTTNECRKTSGTLLEYVLKFQEEQRTKAKSELDKLVDQTEKISHGFSIKKSNTDTKNTSISDKKVEEKLEIVTNQETNQIITEKPLITESPTTPVVSNGRVLKIQNPTMKGNDIMYLQIYLNTYGYSSPQKLMTDGIFGNMTKRAVINFQKANGLIPDGAVGPLTSVLIK